MKRALTIMMIMGTIALPQTAEAKANKWLMLPADVIMGQVFGGFFGFWHWYKTYGQDKDAPKVDLPPEAAPVLTIPNNSLSN